MSKDYLDRTLQHDPDRGPDQVADRTLNRDPAQKPDRDAEPEDDRAGRLHPGRNKEPAAGKGRKPVAAPAKRSIAAAGKKPVAGTGKKPVAAPANKLVPGAGKKPVAGPGRQPAAAAGDQTVILDRTVELRAEQRVEVIIPIEMQIVIEVPGGGKVRGATENVSCNGMLARLNGPVQRDSRCEVQFLGSVNMEPDRVFGRVIRVAKSRYGYAVAFRFERPVRINVMAPPQREG